MQEDASTERHLLTHNPMTEIVQTGAVHYNKML